MTTSIQRKVAVLRQRIEEKRAEILAIGGQERSRADVRARVTEAVAAAHANFLVVSGRSLRQIAAGHHVSEAVGRVTAPDMIRGLLCQALGPEAVTAAILHSVEADVPEGLPAAERAATLADLQSKLDVLERDEEDLIEASELEGAPIARRPDARPEIIAGVLP